MTPLLILSHLACTEPEKSEDTGEDSAVTDSGTEETGTDTSDTGDTAESMYTWIEAGVTLMGSEDEEEGRDSDEDRFSATISQGFCMMRTEVTQQIFFDIMGYNPAMYSDCGMDCPMETANWHEILNFANQWSTQDGLENCYTCSGGERNVECAPLINPYECNGYRLPTEAEWELAARGGSEYPFWTENGGGNLPEEGGHHCGDDLFLSDGTELTELAWYCGNDGMNGGEQNGTKRVAQKLPNAAGIYDMAGNVWEWTTDLYVESLGNDPVTDPNPEFTGDSASTIVTKGGGWANSPSVQRASERTGTIPTINHDVIGFRMVRGNTEDCSWSD